MGAGRSHLDWMKELLATGPLTLKFSTENYINPTRAVVVGKRFAVGDPTGTKAPIVMVGAHIDSVLGAPGAHDDASGNGVSMEIARVVSKLPLDKEIRIGGFGGEEDGLTGSRAYVATLPAAERARFVGEWQMDMVGTPYAPAKLWALTPNGQTNFVVDEAYKAADRFGFTGLQNCRLGQSDHQAFFDVGIPSALFIWLDYRKPANGICGTTGGTYVTEPEYHRPTDGMANISPERLQTTLDVVGGAFAHNALNRVDITTAPNTAVTGDCGDGARNLGTTDAPGQAARHARPARHLHVQGRRRELADRGLRRPFDLDRRGQRGRLRAGDAVADARHAGLLRRVHAGRHADLRGRDDGQRDLDRG